MADAAKTEKPTAKVEKAKREPAIWVVVSDDGTVLSVELNNLRAWVLAGRKRAVVVRWPLGVLREDFLTAAIAEARGEA